MTDALTHDPRRDLRDAAIAYASVAVLVAVLVRLDFQLPLIGHVGSALVAIVLLYAPVLWAWRRREELTTYGFHAEPVGRGVALGLGIPLLVIAPLFTAGYVLFYDYVCADRTLAVLAPPGACIRFEGWSGVSFPALDAAVGQFALVQLIVVALPEELFFRGLLLHLLERAIPPKRRLLGGGVGWALILTSLAFALIHLPRAGDVRSLATFFPGLLFGWMRSATGSILAPVLAHASSNVLVRLLDQIVLGQMVYR